MGGKQDKKVEKGGSQDGFFSKKRKNTPQRGGKYNPKIATD
jgi:hypothetical protein